MKMKTSELDGDLLGYFVALVEYPEWKTEGYLEDTQDLYFDDGEHYAPWLNWSQGGPIIERELIKVSPYHNQGLWWAEHAITKAVFDGLTPLIAAMRCYVASKLGDEVEIPEGLKARVQVCGCFMDGRDVVPFVPDTAAEFYGVYIGSTMMDWAADFSSKEEAMEYAETWVKRGFILDDRTFERREDMNWKLVDKEGKEVTFPYETVDFRGDKVAVIGGRVPHREGSTGRIYLLDNREVYPSVCNLKWVQG